MKKKTNIFLKVKELCIIFVTKPPLYLRVRCW